MKLHHHRQTNQGLTLVEVLYMPGRDSASGMQAEETAEEPPPVES